MMRRFLFLSALTLVASLSWANDNHASQPQPMDKPSPFSQARQSHPRTADPAEPLPPAKDFDATPDSGKASYFPGDDMIASHPSYPLGARVKVTNTANGKSVEVRIVGRFSSATGRVINVSESAARQLDFLTAGTAQVRIEPAK